MRNRENGRFSRSFRLQFFKGFVGIVALMWVGIGVHAGWKWFDSRVRSGLTHTFQVERASAQGFIGPEDWKTEVRRMWKNYGMDVKRMERIVFLESSWNPMAIGDHGFSWGLYQINSHVHSITKSCAFEPVCATYAAIRIFEKQGYDAWSVNRLIQ